MRRTRIFLSLFITLGMLLAACSPSQTGNGTPGAAGYPYPGAETTQSSGGLPITGGTQQPGNTELPSQVLTPTVGITQSVTATETLPTSGVSNRQVDPGRLSNELQFQVVDSGGQPLGQVKDIVLDVGNLKVAYVIVGLSQTSTTTETQVAVPWDMLQVQASSLPGDQSSTTPTTTLQTASAPGAFVFSGDTQQLSGAPEFTPGMLPALGQPAGDWDASLRSYWGEAATGTPATSVAETPTAQSGTLVPDQPAAAPGLQGVVLASQVIGFSIGPSNQPLATVEDVIVDVSTGELRYVVLSITGNKLIPIPPQVLSLDSQNQTFTIRVDPQVLQNAPMFEQGSFPLTIQPNWDADIQTFWQAYIQPAPQQ